MVEQPNNRLLLCALITRGRALKMAGIFHGRMVEQVSRGARPRRGASRCHQGKPLVVIENSLLPCTMVPPGARTCYWCWPGLHPLPAPGVSPNCLVPSACTCCWCPPQSLHTVRGCEQGWCHQLMGAVAVGAGLLADR
uniref:Uncharacterized protein n=1 Tax=Myotis myotis TaxID=51298 RepID=A0A7J7WVY4_MYOMY|nr:hypothetical protein mMyoMyo1_011930 [Myotis myotis]